MSTGGAARTSRLNLIDLAGSESATSSADRQKEGSFINKRYLHLRLNPARILLTSCILFSLLTLGSVIAKLTEPRSAHSHVPFRNSKLTRLLQPALSGKSRVAIICTISPDAEQATETLSTLKFAKRAKMVVTKAERNNVRLRFNSAQLC
jgi:centromeric protein E